MPSTDIIVIGASSGGVEALKTLVHGLSPDLPAAVFIVLHGGAHPSILPDILQSVSALPVSHAIDNGRIENGNIYVAPADHHLILSLGHLHVTRGPKENNARPCVNTLFRTAAITYGNRVAGIVLTGASERRDCKALGDQAARRNRNRARSGRGAPPFHAAKCIGQRSD